MQKSQYYEMNLPDGPDYYNVEDFNQNTRTIDEELFNRMIVDGSNASPVVTFSGALTVGNRNGNDDIGSVSLAEGSSVSASGMYSHAEGDSTVASGQTSHAEGALTKANGDSSHAEGSRSQATVFCSHAEGFTTTASGTASHAEGSATVASGSASHAEGNTTTASGDESHAEGYNTEAGDMGSHAEGTGTKAMFQGAHAEGRGTIAVYMGAHAEGDESLATGQGSHTEGSHTVADGYYSHAEGEGSGVIEIMATDDATAAHAEGHYTTAAGKGAHSEGYAIALGDNRGAYDPHEQWHESSITASGQGAHAEGFTDFSATGNPVTTGKYGQILARGSGSHAEGYADIEKTIIATGKGAHAEGYSSVTASGDGSHAEGKGTAASGLGAHAEGNSTTASGADSHAEGLGTVAGYDNQHVNGKYNSNKSNTLFEVGNGTSNSFRSNAFEVYEDGYISQNNGANKYKFAKVSGKDGYYDSSSVFHRFGTVVEITPTLTSGTKIADYSIDGATGELYAPSGGGGGGGMSTDGTNAEEELVFPSTTVGLGYTKNTWISDTVNNVSKPQGDNQYVTLEPSFHNAALTDILHSCMANDWYGISMPTIRLTIEGTIYYLIPSSYEEIEEPPFIRLIFTLVDDFTEEITASTATISILSYEDFSDFDPVSYNATSGLRYAHGLSIGQGNITMDDGIAVGRGCVALGGKAIGDHAYANSGNYAEGDGVAATFSNQHVFGRMNDNKSDTLLEIGNGTVERHNAFEVYEDGYISQNNGVDKYLFAKENGVDGYYDNDGIFNAFGSGGGSSGITLYETLAVGDTSVSFTHSAISSDRMVDVYTNLPGLNYKSIEVWDSINRLDLYFDMQTVEVTVKVWIH